AINTGSVTTNLQGGLVVGPYGTAAGNTGEIRLNELVANGSNYVALKSPDNLAANVTYTLPAADGSNGQVLTTNAAGTLSWSSVATTGTNLAGDIGGTIGANTIGAGRVTLTHLSATGTKDSTTYLRGDNTWATFATDLLATALTGLSTATNAVIAATDSALVSFGKLQAQITSLGSTKLDKTGGTLSVGTINGVPTPTNADDVANKGYVDGFGQWTKGSGANAGDIYRGSGNVGIGTTVPGTKLEIDGTSGATLKIVDGNQGNGKVLTSDANGVASWQTTNNISAYGMAYNSAAGTLSGAYTAIPMSSGDNNLQNVTHSTTVNPSRLTVSVAGTYTLAYHISWHNNTGSAMTSYCVMKVNGATIIQGSYITRGIYTGLNDTMMGSTITSLNANDYAELYCYANYGSPPYDDSHIMVQRIGP
ncbi:MAG: hypothetical protein ACXVLQ_15625, partial [Bacteriovorax sp.]